jgi:hypothetical protein
MYDKMAKTADYGSKGEYYRAIESFSPIFVENLMKSYRMGTEGMTTPHGKQVFDTFGKPLKLTATEAALQAAGFRPERLATSTEEYMDFTNMKTRANEQRTKIYDMLRTAKSDSEKVTVAKMITKYNLKASQSGGAVTMITAESIRNALKQEPRKDFLKYGAQIKK